MKHLICHPESSAHERTGTRLPPEAQEGGTGRNWDPGAVDTRGRRTEAIMWVCFQLTWESMSCRCSDLIWGHGVEQERDEAWRLPRDVWISALCVWSINVTRCPAQNPSEKTYHVRYFVQSYVGKMQCIFFFNFYTFLGKHSHFFSWNLCRAFDLVSSSHPFSTIFPLSIFFPYCRWHIYLLMGFFLVSSAV